MGCQPTRGLTNERDFPVPSEPCPVRVAVYGNKVPRWRKSSHQLTCPVEGEIMAIVTAGIDLAKNVFAVHCVDESDKPDPVRPEVPRAKLLELIAHLLSCLIAYEDAADKSHWRWANSTNPLWRSIGNDHGIGMESCRAALRHRLASSRCPGLRRQAVSRSVPYLGPRWQQRNKPVCRCAVCSSFDRSFQSPKCKNTVYQARRPNAENQTRRLIDLEVPVRS